MSLATTLLAELDQEAVTTRRVLERVPTDKLSWQPHPKSMSLGQLALHVAMTPGAVAQLSATSPASRPSFGSPPVPASTGDVLEALDQSLATARSVVGTMDDAMLLDTWTMADGGKTMMALPRIGLLRAIMLNHWYHHRGQLSVYLRQLDVPLPSIYGPSADESPF